MVGTADFYERQAYIFMYPGWGDGRSVVVSGYKYYPNVAAFIDTNGYSEMKVGEKFVGAVDDYFMSNSMKIPSKNKITDIVKFAENLEKSLNNYNSSY